MARYNTCEQHDYYCSQKHVKMCRTWHPALIVIYDDTGDCCHQKLKRHQTPLWLLLKKEGEGWKGGVAENGAGRLVAERAVGGMPIIAFNAVLCRCQQSSVVDVRPTWKPHGRHKTVQVNAFSHHCPVTVEGHADHAPLLCLVLGAVGGHRPGVRVEDVVAGDVGLGEAVALVADRPAQQRVFVFQPVRSVVSAKMRAQHAPMYKYPCRRSADRRINVAYSSTIIQGSETSVGGRVLLAGP